MAATRLIGSLFAVFLTTAFLIQQAASQRPIIRGFTLLIGNCADMFLNEKPIKLDVQECANECQRYTGCRGFSFDYLEQHCWLKWGLCDRIKPARLTPVVFYKNELWGFTAEMGSCPGQMAVPPVFTDVVACASQCRTMANCSGFTYDFEGDVCYLKAASCPTTLPNDVLAVESWVKYFRKDFWVPAALERTRKYLDDDDPAGATEYLAQQQQTIEQNTSNPLEMVFFDNNNAPSAAMTLHHNYPVSPSTSENDPWEAYANPSDGSDYMAISDEGVKILVHRATIANASEATCSRACSLDAHCSYFYLLRTEVTVVSSSSGGDSNEKDASTELYNNSENGAVNNKTTLANIKKNKPAQETTIIQQNCVLFSKWNASAGVSNSKRRQPDEGKLFQKVAHMPRGGKKGSQQQQQQLAPDQQAPSPHHVTLVSLRKKKRNLDEGDVLEVNSNFAPSTYKNDKISPLLLLTNTCFIVITASWRLSSK